MLMVGSVVIPTSEASSGVDLIVVDITIDGEHKPDAWNFAYISVKNIGDTSCNTSFYVQLRQDNQTGRLCGTKQITVNISQNQTVQSGAIIFKWQGYNHTMWAQADMYNNVNETNENNNWYSEFFRYGEQEA